MTSGPLKWKPKVECKCSRKTNNVFCPSTGKFSGLEHQPVSSLPPVEEPYPAGISGVQPEPARSAMHAGPKRITVVEPDSVPDLDVGYVENRLVTPTVYQQTHQDTVRKEFGTQTGLLPFLYKYWLMFISRFLYAQCQ